MMSKFLKPQSTFTYAQFSLAVSAILLLTAVLLFPLNAHASDSYNYLNFTAVPNKAQQQVVKPTSNTLKTLPPSTLTPATNNNNLEASVTMGNPAYLVVPIKSDSNRMSAYGDLVDLVANDFAVKLRMDSQKQHLPYGVIQPAEVQRSVPTLGLTGVYNDIIEDYRKAGRPDPSRVQFFTDKYSETGNKITGIIFIEATFDPMGGTTVNRQIKSPLARIFDITSIFNMPDTMDVNYLVNATATMFDVASDDAPIIWQTKTMSKIPMQSVGVFQSSIYATDTALTRFSPTSELLANKMLTTFPGITPAKKQSVTETGQKTVRQVFGQVKNWVQGE